MHRWITRPLGGVRIPQHTNSLQYGAIRHASLNHAIGRGIRRSQPRPSPSRDQEPSDYRPRSRRDESRPPRDRDGSEYRQRSRYDDSRPPRDRDNQDYRQKSRRDETKPSRDRDNSDYRQKSRYDDNRPPRRASGDRDYNDRPSKDRRSGSKPFDKDEFIRSGRFQALPRELQSDRAPRWNKYDTPSKPKPATKSRVHRITETEPERVKDNVKVPDSIPYTTPASEFIYGTSAVEAALRCSRRQIYKLYIYQAAGEELSPAKVSLRKLALVKNIGTKMAFAGWDRLFDKMSAGRPHNGCILEASPLPKLPVRALGSVPTTTESHFRVELAPQTKEEALVNGTNDQVEIVPSASDSGEGQRQRFPVALLLDGVVDPGNMGAIIRSAYYLGIDAIILAGRNSAPLSPVTIKASAGAAENMTILHVKNEVDFIQRSQANGWRFYAADAPGPGATYVSRAGPDGTGNSGNILATQSPSVLMMGSEGSGLSSHIKSHADAIVSIPGARHGNELGVRSDPARIDSLNVSVASALLMEMFLRTPLLVSESMKKVKEKMW